MFMKSFLLFLILDRPFTVSFEKVVITVNKYIFLKKYLLSVKGAWEYWYLGIWCLFFSYLVCNITWKRGSLRSCHQCILSNCFTINVTCCKNLSLQNILQWLSCSNIKWFTIKTLNVRVFLYKLSEFDSHCNHLTQ